MTVKIVGGHFDAPGLELDGAYIDQVYRCLACGKVETVEAEAYPSCVGPFAMYYFGQVETNDGEVLAKEPSGGLTVA